MSIVVKNLSKCFVEKTVLNSVDMTLKSGSRTCVMGASGRGKTTLFNILLGLVRADSGEISGVPERISAVFQEDRLCEAFSAVANVLAVTGKSVAVEDIEKCLTELGLADSMYQPVSSLSGGMRRRVAIARALLAESEFIVFDEAFKGLDDATREKTVQVILSRTNGKTLLFSTHDARDAELLGAEIINM